jgi:transposase
LRRPIAGNGRYCPSACLDDFTDESNPVRVIDVFVGALDLAEMSFEGVEPAATGRPSYHPSVLLKLYIYSYLNRVQSSRRLEREAGRNVEVMWLLGPRNGASCDGERRHRWQQVQGREQSGQELHKGEGATAACSAYRARYLAPPTAGLPCRDVVCFDLDLA